MTLPKHKILVAGLQKQSLIDYPGKVASVIFLAGCNMRCHYCQNAHLFDLAQNKIKFSTVLRYIKGQRHLLDAVVVSGGEPTLDPNLPQILRALRRLGLLVKLDTNGTNPDLVQKLVKSGLVDMVALDIKAPPHKHQAITGLPIDHVLRTVEFLKGQTKVDYLLRTTVTPKLTLNDLCQMGETMIRPAKVWQIQQCRVTGAYSPAKIQKMAVFLEKYAQHIVVVGL